MRKKTTYFLIVILVSLIIGFVIQRKNRDSETLSIIKDRRIVNFDEIESIDKIMVRNKGTEVNMSKKDGLWHTKEGYAVYKQNVEELLTQAKDAVIYSVASYSLDNKEEFYLDEKNAYEYVFEDGEKVVGSFQIGQGDFGNGYVIRHGDDTIASILNPHSIFFNYEWRDRVVEDTVASRHIQEVIIKKGDRYTTLKKEEGEDEEGKQVETWYVNGKKADQEKANAYIAGLTTATASGFPEKDDEFEPSDTTVKIKTKSESFLITLGQKKDDEQTFIKNSRGLIYLVNTEKTIPKFVIRERDVL